MNLKEIKTKFTVEFTPEEVIEYNTLVKKNKLERGIPTADADRNECPYCGELFVKWMNYCPNCGQYVRFVESDVIPL